MISIFRVYVFSIAMKIRWIPWVISIVFMVFLLSRLTEYEQLAEALNKSNGLWVIAALGFQVGFFLLFAKLYQMSFQIVSVEFTYRRMVPIVLAALFLNCLTPSVGMAGAATYVRQAGKRGYTAIRTMTGFMVETVLQQTGFLLVLIGNIIILMRQNGSVGQTEKIIVLGISVAIFLQVMIFALGFYFPGVLEWMLRIFSKITNWLSRRIRKKELVSDKWSKNSATEMKEAVRGMWSNKWLWVRSMLVAIMMEAFMLASFQSLFFAFGEGVNIQAAISGYITANVTGSILIGPYGVGLVEAGLTIILTHYDIARGAAALISVVFRGMNFWMPFIAGFVSFRRLRLFGGI